MPHVVVQYTANLEPDANMGALCKALAEVLVTQRDGAGARVFPIGGTRVLAYPATARPIARSSTSTHGSRAAASARSSMPRARR